IRGKPQVRAIYGRTGNVDITDISIINDGGTGIELWTDQLTLTNATVENALNGIVLHGGNIYTNPSNKLESVQVEGSSGAGLLFYDAYVLVKRSDFFKNGGGGIVGKGGGLWASSMQVSFNKLHGIFLDGSYFSIYAIQTKWTESAADGS